ncbi:MAG: tryptophan--tRNA ligase [Chloroflexia bacterium]|nr:tryptophan--tRNA ligase [Chloroflexia bacterium]
MSLTSARPRLLTGDRPTGPLHLGHLVGSLRNRVRLQATYDAYFIIADLHMLTTRNTPEDIAQIDQRACGLVLDALSAGIEPEHADFYLQSAIPEVHELAGLLQSLVTVSRLERLPALKDMARDSGLDMSFALLGYPVLQSADILSVRANAVPVGKDNYAFVEITRELARRFNGRYGEVFPIPEIIAGEAPTLIGTDGKRKMSKSLDNAVALSDDASTVRRKVMRMYTDSNRISADVPGTVEGNPVFAWLDVFAVDTDRVEELKRWYRAGAVGDVEVKEYLVGVVNDVLEPMRERRERFSKPGLVEQLIEDGTGRVRAETQETVYAMKRAMGLTGAWNRIRRRAERAR